MLVSLPIYANQIGKSLDNRSISAHIVLPQQLRRVLKSLKAFLELGQHLLIWHSGRVILFMGSLLHKKLFVTVLIHRTALGGKAAKAAALPGFFKIECGGSSAGAAAEALVIWLPCLPKIYCGGPEYTVLSAEVTR